MGRQNAVLVGRSRPAHQFESAEIGREEAEAGHPGRHLASGHEEVFAGVRPPAQVKADGQNQREVEGNDDEIHPGQMHKLRLDQHRESWHHFFSFACP